MRVAFATLAVVLLAAVPPAAAAPTISPAERKAERAAIAKVIDAFVKDNVLRRDLAAGWEITGPDMRGGTTRAAWISGKGVTVQAFPARGTEFGSAFVGKLVAPGHAEGSMILHAKPGTKSADDAIAFNVDVRKLGGRWVVDIFYPAAIFRSSSSHHGSCGSASCSISGPSDFGPQGSGSAYGNGKARISGHAFAIALASIGALILLTPIAIYIRIKRRDRRAFAAYMSTRG